MKITILTHVEREQSKDYDTVVNQVAKALRKGGHRPTVLAVHGDIKRLLSGIARQKPGLIFNLMETFGDDELGAIAAAGFLRLTKIPFTGGGPGEIFLQEDKALAKKLLAYDHIKYPDFAVFSRDADLETGGKLRLPLFVKPLRMDASIGIEGKSLVHTVREMMTRVRKIHDEVLDAALVEEYVEGREFYVGVLGNQKPTAFAPVEIDFSKLPADKPHILDAKAKWDAKSVEYQGTEAVLPELDDELRARLQKVALDAYRALYVRDYGRIDLRLTETGDIYVIEVNASCYLDQAGEFARGAAATGIDYDTLINRIVDEASQRHERVAEKQSPPPRKKKTATA